MRKEIRKGGGGCGEEREGKWGGVERQTETQTEGDGGGMERERGEGKGMERRYKSFF